MNVFGELDKRDHEQVVFCNDRESGLKAIIAIHNTTLGPALGGCRIWPYSSEEDALRDALRLSRGMTYKSAAAGLNLGGGKAVIIGDPKTLKTEQLFRVFGRFVQSLGGRYITAEDVGTTVQDMDWIWLETDYVTGISRTRGGSGDPSPVTAYGVFQGIKAALKYQTDSDSIKGQTVALQGVGQVGYHLLHHLVAAGAKVVASDVNPANLQRAQSKFSDIEFVAAEEILDVPASIFIPCALGGVVNDETLNRFQCPIICGSANNVLQDEEKHSAELHKRNILYIPDFIVNAGGLINVANELVRYERRQAMQQTSRIYDVVLQVLKTAEEKRITTLQASKILAERRIHNVGRIKHTYVGTALARPRTLRGLN
ncbi:MAG: Glu/Leu/Phe/Val dehydrogenase [Myxococcaceae bacterium]|nr:Glu/Leu/Phe/Val dehydrogenase [Myxococcaceae bacterium]MBH2006882.1 Glu/Leu/Phe/Val dehydrogenase [Myxococcaceae bacterium]